MWNLDGEFRFRSLGVSIPFSLNAKGLFTVGIAAVLEMFAQNHPNGRSFHTSEVVTYTSDKKHMVGTNTITHQT